MPGWQRYYLARHTDEFAFVSVAIDIGGPEAVRVWTERAGAQFPTVIDADNQFGAVLGFKAIPNGVVLDRQGIIRYAKFGGFEVNRPEDLQAVESAMQPSAGPVAESDNGKELKGADQERVAALLRDGTAKLHAGDREAGLTAWRAALRLDPDNLVIRKQLWRADHPERFGEEIDAGWQKDQLTLERQHEAAAGG